MFSTFRDNSRRTFEDFLLIAENIDNRIPGDIFLSGIRLLTVFMKDSISKPLWVGLNLQKNYLAYVKSQAEKNSLRIAFGLPVPKPS